MFKDEEAMKPTASRGKRCPYDLSVRNQFSYLVAHGPLVYLQVVLGLIQKERLTKICAVL